MPSDDYFEQLEDEFKDHPYKDRLLEELQDHLEDYEEDEEHSEQHLADARVIFDEPDKLKKIFVQIVDFWTRLFYLAEGIVIALLCSLVALYFFDLLSGAYFSDQNNGSSKWVYFLLFQLLWLVFYDTVFSLLQNIKPYTAKKSRLWFLAICSPGFLTFLMLTLFKEASSSIKLTTSFVGIYLVFNGLMASVSWLMTRKRKRAESNVNSLTVWAGFFIFLVMGRTLITYFDVAFVSENTWFLWILFPIFFLDVVFFVPWNNLAINESLPFYSPGIFLITICAVELVWMLLKPKKWLLRTAVFVYVSSFFFMNQNAFFQPQQFKQPSIAVSELIERKEAGIFYPHMNYVAYLDQLVFNSNQVTPVRSNYELFSVKISSTSYFVLKKADKCYWIEQNKLAGKFNVKSYEALFLSGEINCPDLRAPENILKKPAANKINATEAVLSEDKKWLLLSQADPDFDVETVYLIKLEE